MVGQVDLHEVLADVMSGKTVRGTSATSTHRQSLRRITVLVLTAAGSVDSRPGDGASEQANPLPVPDQAGQVIIDFLGVSGSPPSHYPATNTPPPSISHYPRVDTPVHSIRVT